ncbi:cation ABC transporter permease [Acidithiobacillus marinus]|uniref:Cation ABC transporter permease n=1 Tax=Acidithiobacillus marinus TaxID=187490 RepID=A0A2I1DP31_9PROT|nr:metal ABC transporter permease [Acidithiobacillus marinus]PKY11630.1 cation ABC transporter permease [Acidithiobacillus marinus]
MFSSFMINTWIAGTAIALVAAFVGYFVVIRRSAFAAHALPLGAFPGAAAANLLGVNPFVGLLIFVGIGMLLLRQLARMGRRDVGTGLLLVLFLGVGALFLSMTNEYAPEVFSLLFGEMLGVSKADLWPILGICAVVSVLMITIYQPLLLDSSFPDLAALQGISGARMDLLFLSLLALVTASALPVVGAFLVFTLLVGPPAAAQALSRHPLRSLLLAVVFAECSIWLAIALSYWSNWPIGFFVGMIGAGLFTLARSYRSWSQRQRGARRVAVP